MFEGKSETKKNENSLQYIYKLLLNSLYRRFGMKEIENKLKILSKEEAKKIMKKKIVFYIIFIYLYI